MRSLLTMLGVIIGIASIIAIVSTIKGTNEQIMENLIGAGNNNVTITLRQGEEELSFDWGSPPAGVFQTSEDQMEQIRGLDGVEDASFYLSRSYAEGLTNGVNSLSSAKIRGIDTHYLNTCGYRVYSGRPIVEGDRKAFRKVALIDTIAAEGLFPEQDAVGGTLEIKGEPFTVVGLIEKRDDYQPVINSLEDYYTYFQEDYGMVLIPDTCWPIVYRFDEPLSCVVRTTKTEDMSTVGRDAAKIMNQSVMTSNSEISYKAEDLIEKARNQQKLASSTNNLLIWVASIALLVGGIGVMNIMLVSVTERTSEIGLKKALGANKRRILFQFLTESAMLTSMGGVFGVIAGILLSFFISKVTETRVAISIPAAILAVAFSMVIGILFGLLPSVKASNLNPIEALQRD